MAKTGTEPRGLPGRLPVAPTSPGGGRRIVVGLGNPVLGDDGVGWRIADAFEAALAEREKRGQPIGPVEVERLGVGGLRLMEFLTGFDDAILVDAAEFQGRPPGEIRVFPLEELDTRKAGHLNSAHDVSLPEALDMARRLGARLPGRVRIVTVQIARSDEFGEELSPAVGAAVQDAVTEIVRLLGTP